MGQSALPAAEIEELVSNADDQSSVVNYLIDSVSVRAENGPTKASLALDELILHCDLIESAAILNFLSAILSIAVDLNVECDDGEIPGSGRNREKIQLLCRRLTFDRLALESRSQILLKAFEGATLSVLVHFSDEVWAEHHDPRRMSDSPPDKRLLCIKNAEVMRIRAVDALRRAAESRVLLDNRELHSLLYRWRDLAVDNSQEVRAWSSQQLGDDDAVVKFAKALTTYGILHSGGDAVSSRSKRVQLSSLDEIVDRDRLRARCEELESRSDLPADYAKVIAEFLAAWRQREAGRGG